VVWVVEFWTGLFTLFGVIITVAVGNTKTIYRIEQLEKKVQAHNNLVVRMYEAEKDIDIIKSKLKE
jgi:ABC-type protease/lipase transport system fused ATPase/permease subunit